MKKVDLRKELKHLYQASANDVVQVEVPAFKFLMVDGKGDPNTSQEYAQAVEALFSVSYTAKFMVKKGPQELDYSVMPLEGLWWADDMSAFRCRRQGKLEVDNEIYLSDIRRTDQKKWKTIIRQPMQ